MSCGVITQSYYSWKRGIYTYIRVISTFLKGIAVKALGPSLRIKVISTFLKGIVVKGFKYMYTRTSIYVLWYTLLK